MNRRQYLTTAVTAVGGVALAGCSEEGDADEGNANGGDPGNGDTGGGNSGGGDTGGDDQPDVEIQSHEFYEEQFSAGVRGTAQNTTDRELSYVEAEAVFLDSEGTQIGEGLDNVSDLAAGRTWEFDCMFLGEDASRIASYEIEVSTGL
jgi:hypothetical protein